MGIFNLENLERIMVFGAHPDDEIFCGGTIHRLSSKGREVYVVTFTGGETCANSKEEVCIMKENRKQEAKKADEILGITKRISLGIQGRQVYREVYGDTKLNNELISVIREYQPELLFTHMKDNHRDHNAIHQITNESVFSAGEDISKNLGDAWTTPILYYGVEQELPKGNMIIEISKENLEAKLKAIASQLSQTRDDYIKRFEELIESRAKLYGARFFGAGRYAEVFYLDEKSPVKIKL